MPHMWKQVNIYILSEKLNCKTVEHIHPKQKDKVVEIIISIYSLKK